MDFALSNRPHLHRAYLVTIPFDLILAVKICQLRSLWMILQGGEEVLDRSGEQNKKSPTMSISQVSKQAVEKKPL